MVNIELINPKLKKILDPFVSEFGKKFVSYLVNGSLSELEDDYIRNHLKFFNHGIVYNIVYNKLDESSDGPADKYDDSVIDGISEVVYALGIKMIDAAFVGSKDPRPRNAEFNQLMNDIKRAGHKWVDLSYKESLIRRIQKLERALNIKA